MTRWALAGSLLAASSIAVTASVAPHAAVASPPFSSAEVVDEFVASPGWGIASAAWMSDGRMLATELFGGLYLIDPTNGQSQKLFDVPGVHWEGELGLLDVAVHPDFASNGYFYVYFTNTANRVEIARFQFLSTPAATLATKTTVWTNPGVGYVAGYHVGGSLNFGPDGKLYLSVGDNTVSAYSQNLTNVFGKILRINPDGSVPTDNPLYDGAGPNVDEIYAYGLRNPFRASFDSETGDLYVGDVGGNDNLTAYEELNVIVPGANYGWPMCEGPLGPPKLGATCPGGVTAPLHYYHHSPYGNGSTETSRAIVGGMVYRGTSFPAGFRGTYVFGDFPKGDVYWLEQSQAGVSTGLLKQVTSPSTPIRPTWIEVSPFDGKIYWMGLEDNFRTQIRRLRYSGSSANPPVIQSVNVSPLFAGAGSTIDMAAAATDSNGDPITYVWDFGDGTTGTGAQTSHVYPAAGSYSVRLSVHAGVDIVNAPPQTVQIGNRPVPVIAPPSGGTSFSAGVLISVSGTASDVEDGTIPPASLAWTVVFQHDNHAHPVTSGTGSSISIPVSATGHDYSGDTGYRITLTATDSSGLSASTLLDLDPQKLLIPVTSNVPVDVTIDGIVRSTPTTLDTIVGFEHVVSTPESVCDGGTVWQFGSWSDGGARTHTVVSSPSLTSLAVTYNQAGGCGELPAPTGLQADDAGQSVALTWTDNASNETGHLIERARWVAGSWSEWTSFTVPANVTTATDAAVPDGEYVYLVRATAGATQSDAAQVQVTVSQATAPPNAPTNPVGTFGPGGVTFEWEDTSQDELGFDIQRARNVAGVWSEWTADIADIDDETFLDTPPADGLYAYLVRSRNPLGPSAWAIAVVDVSTATAPPAAPSSVTLTSTGNQVTVGWQDNSSDEVVFDVGRARYSGGEWSQWVFSAADRNVTSFADANAPDGLYAYLVRARNSLGASDWAISTVTVSAATSAPAAPSGLSAAPNSGNVVVNWTDNSAGTSSEVLFEVMRAQLVNGSYTGWISTVVDRDVTTYVDPGTPAGTYAYLVRATNPIGSSDWAVVVTTVSG